MDERDYIALNKDLQKEHNKNKMKTDKIMPILRAYKGGAIDEEYTIECIKNITSSEYDRGWLSGALAIVLVAICAGGVKELLEIIFK